MSGDHTPGPWVALKIRETNDTDGAWFLYAFDGRRFMFLDGDGNEDVVSEADVRVIAAAPLGFDLAQQVLECADKCPEPIVDLAKQFLQIAMFRRELD